MADRARAEEAFRQEVLAFLDGHAAAEGCRDDADVRSSGLARAPSPSSVRWPRPAWPASPGRPSTAGAGCPGASNASSTARPRPSSSRPARSRSASACAGRRSWCTPARSRSRRSSRPSCAASTSGASSSASPAPARTCSSVQTRARRDGDEFVLDGQKVWTSGAQHSDYAACLARTDPDAAQARGHHHAHRRHARAGHHGASAAPDDRRRPLQRGLPRRGAGAGGQRGRRDRTTAGAWPAPCWPSSARRWAEWARAAAARAASPPWWPRPGAATWRPAPSCATASCSCASARWSCGTSPATCRSKARQGDAGGEASLLKLAMAQLVQESALGRGRDRRACMPSRGTADDPDGGRWSRPAAQLAVGLHRRRHQRDRAQRHRRASARAAARRGRRPHAGRPRCARRRGPGRRRELRGAAPARCSVGSSRSVSTSRRPSPRRSSPTWAPTWSRSSDPAAIRCGPTRPASPPGTVARSRSSSTCASAEGRAEALGPHRRGRPAGREPAAGRAGAPRPGARRAARRASRAW